MEIARVFILISLSLHFSLSRKIQPEIVRDLSIHLCSHERSHTPYSFGLLQFSPSTVQWCITATTNKSPSQYNEDFSHSTKSSSIITFSWAPIASPISCSLQFQGHQSSYRLSPDFGTYSACQSNLSKHVHNLSHSLHKGKGKKQRRRREEDVADCPIIAFPQSYNEFSSCTLKANTWYRLDAKSTISHEQFSNGSYSTHWSNASSHFIFQSSFELERNGTFDQWMGRILSIDTRMHECADALIHITVTKEWTGPNNVTLIYRYHEGHTWKQQSLTRHEIIDWELIPLHLKSGHRQHQVCAHLSHESAKRGRVCHIFSLPQNCTISSSSPLFNNSAHIVTVISLLLISRFID